MMGLAIVLGVLLLCVVSLWVKDHVGMKATIDAHDGILEAFRDKVGALQSDRDQWFDKYHECRGRLEVMAWDSHKDLAPVASEWARHGSQTRNLDLDQTGSQVVQALIKSDEARIIADHGYRSEMHEAFLNRNGAPGEERIPLGIQNRITGTVDELAAGLVDHDAKTGGRLCYSYTDPTEDPTVDTSGVTTISELISRI